MFSVSILDIETAAVISQGTAYSVVLPGEEGELSIFDFHQEMVSVLKKGVIRIDETPMVQIERGIVRVDQNQLIILVEK